MLTLRPFRALGLPLRSGSSRCCPPLRRFQAPSSAPVALRVRCRASDDDKPPPEAQPAPPEGDKDASGSGAPSKPSSEEPNTKLPLKLPDQRLKAALKKLGGKPVASQPDSLQLLAGYGAYTGFVGTLAILLAQFNHIDLFGSFRFDAVTQLELGLLIMVPMHALNLGIMLPNYGNWRLPVLAEDDADAGSGAASSSTPASGASVDQQQRPAAHQPTASSPTAADPSASASPSASSSSSSSSSLLQPSDAASTSSPPGTSPSDAPAPPSASGSLDSMFDEPASPALDEARAPRGSASSSASSSSPLDPRADGAGRRAVPAAQWGATAEGGGKAGFLRTAQDALHLAQGAYMSRSGPPSPLGGGGASAPAALAGGAAVVVLETLARELLQRGVALTLLAGWLSNRMYEAGLDDSLMLPGGPVPLPTVVAAQWAATGLMVLWGVARTVRNTRLATQRLDVMLDLKNRIGSTLAKGKDKATVVQVVVPSAGWAGGSFDAVTASAVLQGGRDIAQMVTLNAVFTATGGNLAASFTAALSHQLLFSALQEVGRERLKQRSTMVTAELKRYTVQLQRIAEKQVQRRAAQAAAKAAAPPEAQSPASSSSSSSTDAADPHAAPPQRNADGGFVPAGMGAGNGAWKGLPPRGGAASSASSPAAARPSAPENLLPPDSRISRSMSMLDTLLGIEEEGSPAAGPGSGSGAASK